MITEDTLTIAVERGFLSTEQAARLRELEAERSRSGAEPQDDEKLRFLSGFGDVFVTIGLGLFIGAAGYFLRSIGPLAMWAGIAVLAWVLAELFTRIRRMALPSIVLLVVFAGSSYVTLAHVFGASAERLVYGRPLPLVANWLGLDLNQPLRLAAAALASALLVALHYRRFRVPITVAAGVAALWIAALSLAFALAPASTVAWIDVIVLAAGLVVFALAMRFDMSDPLRATRRTDIAFWLHLLAAPMIVHPLIAGMFDVARQPDGAQAIGILAVFLALAAIAVLVDRRALLVSGLTYAGIAFATLLRNAGLSGQTVPATLLVLGAFVLLLSVAWHPLRRVILAFTPPALARRLPNPLSHASA